MAKKEKQPKKPSPEQILMDNELYNQHQEVSAIEGIEDDMDMQDDAMEEVNPQSHMNGPTDVSIEALKNVIDAQDRFKTSYLTWDELGKPVFSTRFWISLSNTCKVLYNFEDVADYCLKKARVTTDTSLSRDGFMINKFVEKRTVKSRSSNSDVVDFLKTRGNDV